MENKPFTKKFHKNFSTVTDKVLLAELNKTITKEKQSENGYWAICSEEKVDSDGDIIMIDGITSDLDPENGRYIPLLPGHQRRLPDGKSPEIGRIEQLVKTTNGKNNCMAMYFTFALDDNGQPMDDLVASYYNRYKHKYLNTFSVGMDAIEQPIPLDTGGYKFTKTYLFEVSAVSIPANSGAVGITRSAEDEQEDSEMDKLIQTLTSHISKLETLTSHISKIETLTSHISKLEDLANAIGSFNDTVKLSFKAAFEPLEARLDILESTLVTLNTPKVVEATKKEDVSGFKKIAETLDKTLNSQ